MAQLLSTTGMETLSLSSLASTVRERGTESIYLSYTWSLPEELARALDPDLDAELLPPHLAGWEGAETGFQTACSDWLNSLGRAEITELLREKITGELYHRLADRVEEHPLFLQLLALSEFTLETGWCREIDALFRALEREILNTASSYRQMWVAPEEWTFESFLGDAFLTQGLELIEEGVLDLREALRADHEDDVRLSLDWLAEGVFYLLAVEEWGSKPWI